MTVTPAPSIDALPAAPSRSMSSAAFVVAADAFLSDLPVFGAQVQAAGVATQANAAAAEAAAAEAEGFAQTSSAAVAASHYVATSNSSLSLTDGAKAFSLVESGLLFANGDRVTAKRRSDPAARASGLVSAASMGSTPATMTVTFDTGGSGGPYTDWLLILTDLETLQAATANDVRAGSTNQRAVTPQALASAAAFVPLADAATVAWNATNAINARVTLGGNRTIGAPTGMQDGLTYTLELVQDGTGGRLPSWNAMWDFGAAGAPTLQTGATKRDKVFGQYNSATGKIDATFRKGA